MRPSLSRLLLCLLMPLALAACAAESTWAPDDQVQRALYRHHGPPSITLFTVVSNRSGAGGHTALLVNGSHRAVFDPAGTFHHPALPERNDVVYGMTDAAVEFYKDYHARETYHVVSQEMPVSAEVAELALQKIQAYGPVPQAQCATATTAILSELPGFESMPRTFSPIAVMRAFDRLPGVRRDEFHDDSPANNATITVPAVL